MRRRRPTWSDRTRRDRHQRVSQCRGDPKELPTCPGAAVQRLSPQLVLRRAYEMGDVQRREYGLRQSRALELLEVAA